MTNILTAAEAAGVLRVDASDAAMLALLPLVDGYIKTATGHDWTADSPILSEAKAAARILVALWYDNPAMAAGGSTILPAALTATLTQLEALALRYKEFEGVAGAGSITLPGARVGDTVSALVGIVGVSGSQTSKFESIITVDDQIQQTSTDDLSGKFYRVYLVPLGAL